MDLLSNIAGVTLTSQQTSAGSTRVRSAASQLATSGQRLRKDVERFL